MTKTFAKWLVLFLLVAGNLVAIEIPLDTMQPVRIGYVDLQRVFDSYPEKSFAEGDLLREIEKRRRDLNRRQTEIHALRAQISADQQVLQDAKQGREVTVPVNSIPEPEPAAPAVATSTSAAASVGRSTYTAVEPYPTEDPLAGLPGHENPILTPKPPASDPNLPGMTANKQNLLDTLAAAGTPALLTEEARTALTKRADNNQRRLDRAVSEFRRFRSHAVGDMKQLQSEKTYGVMSKIYAILQILARDENVSVVLDKAYVLYGEDTVDLSEKLITRLQREES